MPCKLTLKKKKKKESSSEAFSTRVNKPEECFTLDALKLSSLGVIGLTLATWVD